jgi:hypothetical protein
VLSSDAPPPPPDLRASVLAGIVGVEQLPPVPGRPRRAMASTGQDEPELVPVAAPVVADPADELALRRASRRTRALSLAVAAVTVVALALGGAVYSLARQAQAPQVAEPPVTQPSVSASPQVDPSLLAAPDARILRTTLTNGAKASFVVSKSQNRAAFVSTDLPSPGAGNEYHLWTLKGKTVRPDNTFPGGADQTQVFSGPIDDSTQLAVNIEPAGTNPQVPTTDVLGGVKI